MELTRALLRLAAARPHALLAVAPSATAVRLAVERSLRERGWPLAASPADADLLVVCGRPGAQLASVIDELWQQIPQPRRRVEIADPAETDKLLERTLRRSPDAAGRLLTMSGSGQGGANGEDGDSRDQSADPHRGRDRDSPAGEQDGVGAHAEHGRVGGHPDAGDHVDQGDGAHNQHRDSGGREPSEGVDAHGAHGSGEHAGHGEGAVVAGLPLASRAFDRDGLKLDQLHLPLGPILADWPSGLVVRAAMQGDVIQGAEVFVVDEQKGTETAPFWDEPWLRAAAGELVGEAEAARRRAAAHLDSLGRLLAVAGWQEGAMAARRLRDQLLGGVCLGSARSFFARLERRVRGSRLLGWQLAGLGRLEHESALAHGVGGPVLRADGDVRARLLCWLDETREAIGALDSSAALEPPFEGPRGPLDGEPPSRALLDVLPELLIGCELAGARLVVASLDPDSDELVRRPAAPVAVHG